MRLTLAFKLITRIIGGSGIVGMKLEQGVGLKNIGIIHDRINVFNDMKKKFFCLNLKYSIMFYFTFLVRFLLFLLIE